MTFNAGETVFTLGGQEVEYVASAGSKHLVRPIYDTDHGSWAGDEFIADVVFKTPPTEKLHAEVKELEAKLHGLRAQAWEAQREVRDAEAPAASRMKELAKLEPLKRLEDFIAGRITHFVETSDYSYGVRVVTFKEAMEKEGRYDRGFRLLSLFGSSNGDLAFRVNRYSDGSGLWTDSEPFCTEEDALDRARQIVLEKSDKAMRENRIHNLSETIKCAETLGVTLPKEHINAYNACMREAVAKFVVEAEKKLAEAQARLAMFQ